jgi:hypothetical protein
MLIRDVLLWLAIGYLSGFIGGIEGHAAAGVVFVGLAVAVLLPRMERE